MVKRFLIAMAVVLSLSLFGFAQEQAPSETSKGAKQEKTEKKKRGPVFRATKEQIIEVQKKLNVPQTGKMDEATRAAVKKYQSENGLRPTGGLNRATLEKMGVELTEKQKQIPVDPKSYASSEQKTGTKRGPVFRATKEQIEQAQKMLKEKGYYKGEATGKLDKDTREAIKKFQEASGIKQTGTLNAETLEKMGIQLTDKQKEIVMKKSQ
ncbi:MAG: hypothetical protein D6687_05510 [Acidobacteria bacterium]|jgi:peptidoglycan hydrolase-like protein with peptidoglycan-binding domain|nr:MAG: hypothetical protein D6687_05510 [Acidobacteriota bacterium]GIU82749.1 MAG: hypothetical protein KatS3mg006_1813 [Pyrinomonadaceae bacterium]